MAEALISRRGSSLRKCTVSIECKGRFNIASLEGVIEVTKASGTISVNHLVGVPLVVDNSGSESPIRVEIVSGNVTKGSFGYNGKYIIAQEDCSIMAGSW